jgi:hypothetical protein
MALSDNHTMSPREAAWRWGMKRNTLIAAILRGRFDDQGERGLIRRFSAPGIKTVYSITVQAMKEVYGDIVNDGEPT